MDSFLQEVLEQKASVPSSEFEFLLVLTLDRVAQKNGTRPLRRSTKIVYEKISGVSHHGDGYLCNTSP